ncbi:YdgA family protein [Cardiobacteriaceae bacterium TAE3-ERU3]|nr:YdgA family protein [Cardiobacteriaceae bacterium TAE3-ERU3]
MKKTILTIAVLYGVAALGAPYFVGDQIEKNAQQFFQNSRQQQQLAEQGIELSLKQYDKGYFSSTADIHMTASDIITGEVYYDGDFKADIKHAPLSLSGLNAANIHATGTSKPSGSVGDHVPEDFITLDARQSLIDLISGKRNIHTDLALSAVKTRIEDDTDMDFQGLNAHFTASASNTEWEDVKIEFVGLKFASNEQEADVSIKPFTINTETKSDTEVDVKLDKLDVVFNNHQDNLYITLTMNDFVESVSVLRMNDDGSLYLPSHIGLSFSNLTLNSKEDSQTGELHIEDGDFRLGFTPTEGDDYALNVKLKATPKLSGFFAEETPLQPQNIDINAQIAPFTEDYLRIKLQEIYNEVSRNPGMASNIIGSALFPMIQENAFQQDMTTKINASIDGQSGKLMTADGEIHEYLKKDSDIMNMMFDQRKIPQYLHGTKLNIFASEQFLNQTGLGAELGYAQASLIDAEGNLKLDLSITDDQVLLNGQPAPF